MGLKFPGSWRFAPPRGDSSIDQIPDLAVSDFLGAIVKVADQCHPQAIYEYFKEQFCRVSGSSRMRSSSVSWAKSDLHDEMMRAAENPPLFLDILYTTFEKLSDSKNKYHTPDTSYINAILEEHGVGYRIAPPNLVLLDGSYEMVDISKVSISMDEKVRDTIQESLHRAECAINSGRDREAVQETLWLLETVSTAFRGLETGSGTIEEKYFNRIVKKLIATSNSITFKSALQWVTAIHGFLSSPTGGGVRHGLDLREGLELSRSEATLFVNLIRSFIGFFIAEYESQESSS